MKYSTADDLPIILKEIFKTTFMLLKINHRLPLTNMRWI